MPKTPWESRPDIWSTESKFMSWLRGGIRLGLWNKNPIKLEYIKNHRVKIDNGVNKDGTPKKPVWGGKCELCNEVFKQKDLEIDHRNGNHSLKTLDDLQEFIKNIVFVTDEDLQMVCRDCHSAKSYADRMDISFEEAKIEKAIIAAAKDGKAWLIARGVEPASNTTKRKQQIREILENARDCCND